MCGIIGYNGNKPKAIEVLITGLKNLEYRGYDSAGIAYIHDNRLNVIKKTGPIANLEKDVDKSVESFCGIGHTRWATHGAPSIANSHPHTVDKVTIIHNGIIENYLNIKKELIENGYSFQSETDSEVACALLDHLYKNNSNILKAIEKFKERVKGSYAILAIFENREEIYAIKNMSPLIVGLDENECYLASDIHAILDYTNTYFRLDDGDFAKIGKGDYILFDKNGNEKKPQIHKSSEKSNNSSQANFSHFMLKEIYEEPKIAKHLIKKYISKEKIRDLPDISKYDNVTIVACGSAMYAGLVGKFLIEKNLHIKVDVELASEFRYKNLFLNEKSLVIAISQSGETADTLAAVKIAKSLKAHTIGIVNVEESSIAKEVDEVIYTEAGQEIAVATTKAYFAQVLILAFLSLKKYKTNKEQLSNIPIIIENLITNDKLYDRIAGEIYKIDNIFFIGRQIDYAICMEGSLKLKEISYIHSEPYAAGELKHGSISLVSDNTPIFAVITDKKISEKTISNIKEVKARGAHVILLINEDLDFEGDYYDDKIIIPKSDEIFKSILPIIPLQLIAYKIALLRGCSIDKPRNLAKSVTVE